MTRDPETFTEGLARLRDGDPDALDRLFPIVYDELRNLAHGKLRLERPDHTLSTTALVHEAYMRLVAERDRKWQDRAHFLAIASLAMRRILINYAEARRAAKRGGGAVPVPLEGIADLVDEDRVEELLSLEEALNRLEAFNPRGAQVVQLRFYGGLTHEEAAEVVGVSTITVRRAWTAAKAWLRRELGDDLPAEA